MTDNEMRIEIAEELPDSIIQWGWNGVKELRFPFWIVGDSCKLFDPINDLNACHEMEKALTHSQLLKYQRVLCDAVGGPHYAIHATSSQRCEAFLRTIGKWKD